MNILKKIFKSSDPKTGIFFIVEDNSVYAKTLESFLKVNFPDAKDIRIFPVGETSIPELDKNPDVIVMDYFLNDKYFDAETGLENIKQIRKLKPKTNIILLSSNDNPDMVKEAVETYNCSFVKKDDQAFDTIRDLIKQI